MAVNLYDFKHVERRIDKAILGFVQENNLYKFEDQGIERFPKSACYGCRYELADKYANDMCRFCDKRIKRDLETGGMPPEPVKRMMPKVTESIPNPKKHKEPDPRFVNDKAKIRGQKTDQKWLDIANREGYKDEFEMLCDLRQTLPISKIAEKLDVGLTSLKYRLRRRGVVNYWSKQKVNHWRKK